MITLAECIKYLRPEAQWSMIDNDLNQLNWEGPGEPPTQEEINDSYPEAELYYKRLRSFLTRSNFKIALMEKNYLDDVENFMSQTDDKRIQILWKDSDRFNRLNEDLIRMADLMGYTEQEMDALFGIE